MIKFNNETIENAIVDALDKNEKGIEVDRNELINLLLKHADMDFGIKNGNRMYTEEELQCSAYIHIFKNDKCYIGQTSTNPNDRWQCNGINYKRQLVYRAIKKYGWNNTSHIVICNGLTQEEVDEMEVALISLFKSNNREFGYNVSNGGNSVGKHSEETKKKISKANKGKLRSEETIEKIRKNRKGKCTGENNGMYGKQHSEESINKMREVKKGENNPMFGIHRLGGNNPNAKKVYCDEMIFKTGKLCSEFYNINYNTMRSWLQGRNKMPSEFIELGLRYATEEDIETYPICIKESENKIIEVEKRASFRRAKKIHCDKMIFKSIKQCAEFYEVDRRKMNNWLQYPTKTPSEFIELGLRYATQEDIEKYHTYIEEEQ